MSVLPDFQHHRPGTIEEALSLLTFDQVPYSGGTELLLAMRSGMLRPDALIDLKRIGPLAELGFDGDGVHIGGSATHQAVADDERVRAELPILATVLDHVGNPRVRAQGTLGGNLCFAEPKSDVATVLLSLEAAVRLRSLQGERTMPVSDFILGPYTTAREPDELLTGITVPPREDRPATYAKYQTMERPTVGVAAAITSADRVRLVIGAAGPDPAVFEFGDLDEVEPAEVARQVEVIPDMTGNEAYKQHIVALYVGKVCENLRGLT